MILNNGTQPYINDMIRNYGLADWDNSIRKGDESGICMVTIPLVGNGLVTSVIKYYQSYDQHETRFATRESVDQIVENPIDDSQIDYSRGIVFDFALLDRFVSNVTNVPYIEWFDTNKVSTSEELSIQERGFFICVEACVDWYQYDPSTQTFIYLGFNCSPHCYYLRPGFHIVSGGGVSNTYTPPSGNPSTGTPPTGTPPPSPETEDDDKLSDATKKCIKEGGFRFQQVQNSLQATFGDISCGGNTINDLLNSAVKNLIENGDCGNFALFNSYIFNALSNCLENNNLDMIELIQGADPVVNINSEICPDMFEFIWEPTVNGQQGTGFIRDIIIELDLNGGSEQFKIANLLTDIQLNNNNTNCFGNVSQMVSQALNQTIVSAANRINQQMAIIMNVNGVSNTAIEALKKATVLSQFRANLESIFDQCDGGHSNAVADFMDYGTVNRWNRDYGTPIVNFSSFTSICQQD